MQCTVFVTFTFLLFLIVLSESGLVPQLSRYASYLRGSCIGVRVFVVVYLFSCPVSMSESKPLWTRFALLKFC